MSTDRTGTASDRTETASDRTEPPIDPDRLRRRLRRRSAEIRGRELEEAVTRLEARGDLTEEQRETVRELGSALVGELIGAPERALERAAQTEGTGARARARAIRRLYDLDET
ncbi:glutamyl-tRNA reductase [Halorubrum lipolyticum]|uniref:Glutamyl-tRNA reductase n=1 Tax=Halorubrum lipolyticum DSM 21995 TaxID=1227482 RepID=M0P6Z9_9EURY|nr:glutamyl-tRNA reductase [Halorubrum lipolyticum]EMA64610.1 glutamyl-tRNA reductase [Halorubrum lipolyticum DSM 21995]